MSSVSSSTMASSFPRVSTMPSSKEAKASQRGKALANGRALRSRSSADRSIDDSWLGPEPDAQDQERLQLALKGHKAMHTLEDAAYSVQEVCDLLKEFDKANKIPNKNALQICLQHCFLKSASFCAEKVCFDAASLAVQLMEKHRCRFEISTMSDIVKSISLRAAFPSTVAFVRRFIRKTLTHLHENQRSFIARHMVFSLAERKEALEECLCKADTFAEKGLKIDWDSSSAQEFHLYNASETEVKYYKALEGYGFAKKGLVALLSYDLTTAEQERYEYKHQRDGAIVDVVRANEGEMLVVRMRTQVTIPFTAGATYRLDNMDVGDLQVKRITDALQVLGKDPECAKQLPNAFLCQMLYLPPEEPYVARITLKPKVAPLAGELDLNEYGNEPIRVRSIGTGALLEWNLGNPDKTIHVGDRLLKVNDACDKEGMLEEIRDAHQWSKYELKVVFMRKVKAKEHGIDVDDLLPNAEDIMDAFNKEKQALSERLNSSQVEAVKVASTRRLALIQGPPGTGKTTTAVELLTFLLDHKLVPTPILVSGHTNASVDNILAGLAKKGRKVVRIGEVSKVREECKPYMLGEEQAAEPSKAEVICATCSGSGSAFFEKEGIQCHTVLIDEASQATESSCLIPLCHAAQHLILVGDQCQLEPFVKSDVGKSEGLGISLFNRLCAQGVVPTMLDTQYRMHPLISEFPSGAFYNGQLLSGVGHGDRPLTSHWPWPSKRNPVCFVDAKDGAEASYEGKIEKRNEHEVSLVLSALEELMGDKELSVVSEDGTFPVGIVTPYAAQKESIMRELERRGFVDKDGKHLVETNSVDGFQGREKDIIIFSAVRANDEGSVGFLHDWRRINVMLTRAKRGLIIIGHRATLQTDFYWGNWLRWAAMRGCIMGEAAQGIWASRCLVEDEWVMKPKILESSSGAGPASVPGRSEVRSHLDEKSTFVDSAVGSWEDIDTASEGPAEGDVEPSECSFCTHSESDLSCEAVESWEELEEACTMGPLDKLIQESRSLDRTATSNCWEDFLANSFVRAHVTDVARKQDKADQSSDHLSADDSPVETDREPSEASFYTHAESDNGRGAVESWDDPESNSIGGPLDRLGAGSSSWMDFPATAAQKAQDLSTDYLSDSMNEVVVGESAGQTVLQLNSLLSPTPSEKSTADEDEDEDIPPPPGPATRLETGDWFDRVEYHSKSQAAESTPTNAAFQMPEANPMGMQVAWMPMILPLSEAINLGLVAAASDGFPSFPQAYQPPAFLNSSAQSWGWSDASVPHAAQSANETLAASMQQCVQPPQTEIPPTAPPAQVLTSDFDAASKTHHVLWHADTRKLQSNDRSLVSPGFELPFGTFKLMITAKGNGFAKSRGMGFVKLKSESDLRGVDANLSFRIVIGNSTHGPVSNDFSTQSTSLPQQQAMRLLSAGEPSSKTVPIHLEVMQTNEPLPSSESSEATVSQPNIAPILTPSDSAGDAAEEAPLPSEEAEAKLPRTRCRSEAGQQRQYMRHQSRLEERSKRRCAAAIGSVPLS